MSKDPPKGAPTPSETAGQAQAAMSLPPPERQVRFRLPRASEWETYEVTHDPKIDGAKERAAAARERLTSFLLASMQMQNLLILAGSGTSLCVGGPSMSKLWSECVGDVAVEPTKTVLGVLRYGSAATERNIEELLSRCDALLQVNPDNKDVLAFRKRAIETILHECRKPGKDPSHDLNAHKDFLRRLARRRARDPRLRLFTTNYDLCFETAAGALGLVALDGFSFSQPRRFDPRFFEYDLVRRGANPSDATAYVAGVFQYLKLHGSVDWAMTPETTVVDAEVDASRACLIYPATTKFRLSFQQPHLELMAQYLAALREPSTCLLVIGFGFNDAHVTEPLLAAMETNPHFRAVIVSPNVENHSSIPKADTCWPRLVNLIERGADISLVAADFPGFVRLVPDLKALNPAEQLQRAVKTIAGGGE